MYMKSWICVHRRGLHIRQSLRLTMSKCLILLLLSIVCSNASPINGNVVRFVVYAPLQSDLMHLFPGAQIDFTWNNVFIVTIWTNDPQTLIPDIQKTLDENSTLIQVIIPPVTLAAATHKWIEYNLVWVALLLLIFLTGCACGGFAINQCMRIKNEAIHKKCRTTF